MHEISIFGDLVLVLGVSLPVVLIAHRLRIPPIVGFLMAGVVIGPSGLALIPPGEVASLAELGVILLLFTIGLELSLSRVMEMARDVLQGGGLQMLLTIATVALIGLALDVSPARAVFYGALVALSSTAVVLRAYADRGEIDSPHGRVAISVLLFQDLCVIPLMLVVPLLAGAGDVGLQAALSDTLGGLALVTGLVLGGRLVVPFILDRIVLLRNREIFTLTIALLGLSAAFVTARFGLSLAIGAFIAGLVISESEYGLQALSDIRPFRDTFSGIFFTSVGMLLDANVIATQPADLLTAIGALLVLKVTTTTVAVRSLGRPLVTSIVAALGLSQVGEFSFVLASAGFELRLFDGPGYQLFLAVSVLTMLATPVLIAIARPLAERLVRSRSTAQRAADAEERTSEMRGHAIIIGYGLSGRHLASVLRQAGLPYVALEQNGPAVRTARQRGVHIVYGDGTSPDVLQRVGVERARVVVFAISSPADERRGVVHVRELNPGVRIVVRTRYTRSIQGLMELGASHVVVEEFEATIELFARILELYEIPSNIIRRELDALRAEHYGLLRGDADPDMKLDALRHLGIHSAIELLEVEEDSRSIGESPTSLDLRKKTGAVVVAVVRDGKPFYEPFSDNSFQAGDTVVLVGEREALEKAALLFRRAGHD